MKRIFFYPTMGNCPAVIIKIFSEIIRETLHETFEIPKSICWGGGLNILIIFKILFVSTCKIVWI